MCIAIRYTKASLVWLEKLYARKDSFITVPTRYLKLRSCNFFYSQGKSCKNPPYMWENSEQQRLRYLLGAPITRTMVGYIIYFIKKGKMIILHNS